MARHSLRFDFVMAAAVVLAWSSTGCDGESVYRVSGTVTFMGKPVPAGKIYFMPDSSKGNTGPTGYADIKDGKYDTSNGGRGSMAGPVIIAIEGIDPSGPPPKADPEGEVTAKVLFARYETSADMPKSSSTKDIEVPAEASKGPTQKKDPGVIIP
jgi:hypothetical protein